MFRVPDDSILSSSPAPSTPDKSRRAGSSNLFRDSTASSAASTTPAGTPPVKFLGSSIMRPSDKNASSSVDDDQPAVGLFTGIGGGVGVGMGAGTGATAAAKAAKKNLFAAVSGERRRNVPLGRSGRGHDSRQPSRLRKSIGVDDLEDEEEEEEKKKKPQLLKPKGKVQEKKKDEPVRGLFTGTSLAPPPLSKAAATTTTTTTTTTGPTKSFGLTYEEFGESEEEDSGLTGGQDAEGELDDSMWLERSPERPAIGDESDLLLMATPAATERVRREAEDIFRATAMGAGATTRRHEYRYASLAKDVYTQLGTAPLVEPPQLILSTEALLEQLYDEGVGTHDDDARLDETLAAVAVQLINLWQDHVDAIAQPEEDGHVADIGPGPRASPFEKAYWLATLALQLHHTRALDGGVEPLPATLFQWLNDRHDMYAGQVEEILRYRPSPACHSLFWQAVFMSLLRGRVKDATQLLRRAGWEHVRRGGQQRGEYAYSDRALENVLRVVDETVSVLESCPGYDGNWEIWSSEWTLFRVRAQGALEHLRRFAEGKDTSFGDSLFGSSTGSNRGYTGYRDHTLAGLARRAESQVPWDVYESLNVVFDIVLGQQASILEAAQDWLEATIGLFGWWDERNNNNNNNNNNNYNNNNNNGYQKPGRTQALVLHSSPAHHINNDSESYLDRLARAFHAAVASDFHFNSQNPVEIGMACIFEDNIKGVIGLLRSWSLPIAAAVAQVASLGRWLPPHRPKGMYALEDLDMDDLEVLGVDPGAPDEVDGVKDSTLVQYAQALVEYEGLETVRDRAGVYREGWELAISVLGRMDSPERSEEMVRDIVEHLVQGLTVDSTETVDRLWTMLNELSMITYAEEMTEVGSC